MFSFRALPIGFAAMLFTACSTTTPMPAQTQEVSAKPAQIEVRANTRPSEDLFEIEDPLTLAAEARWNGDFDTAYTYFHQAHIAAPDNVEIAIAFSELALKTRRTAEALKALKRFDTDVLKANPKLFSARVLAEIAAGQSEDPELQLNQAIENDLTDPRLWNALGQFHDKAGKPLRAQDAFLTALSTGRADASVINNLGMSLLLQGQKKQALDKFQHALELDNANELFDNNRRLTHVLLSNYDLAFQGIEDERHADILNDAGFISKRRGETRLAYELFSKAINISPRHHAKAQANLDDLSSRAK